MKHFKHIIIPIFFAIFAFDGYAQRLQTFRNAYIWAQGNRNDGSKGSTFSTRDGRTFSMEDVLRRTDPKAIDFMLFNGRLNRQDGFFLFAPNDPTIEEINWDNEGGTAPFRRFTAGSREPQGPAWLKNWNVRNATRMQIVTEVDFDNITGEQLAAMNVEERYIAGPLKEGDIVLFETASTSSNPNKKGLIRVGRIEPDERAERADNPQFSKMNMSVKVIR
jgi:hypothetical protein